MFHDIGCTEQNVKKSRGFVILPHIVLYSDVQCSMLGPSFLSNTGVGSLPERYVIFPPGLI